MSEFMVQLIVLILLIVISCAGSRGEKQKTKYYEEKMYEHAAKGEFEAAETYGKIVDSRRRNKM